jgi:hypothetical protein
MHVRFDIPEGTSRGACLELPRVYQHPRDEHAAFAKIQRCAFYSIHLINLGDLRRSVSGIGKVLQKTGDLHAKHPDSFVESVYVGPWGCS